jgi:hypothetical protein
MTLIEAADVTARGRELRYREKDVKGKLKRERTLRNKVDEKPTKMGPMGGTIEGRMIRCGKPNCKCAKGDLHGPYYVRRWREYGKRCSKYVKKGDVSATFQALSEHRRQQKQARMAIGEAMKAFRGIRFSLLHLFSQGK